MTLVIFTEEPSMREALKPLLEKLNVAPAAYRVISFDGAGNMKNALPGQLRALSRDPAARVLVLRDNDNGNCLDHKKSIVTHVAAAGLSGRAKVRIVCQMLEGWFIGDSAGLEKSRHIKKPIPRRLTTCNPDNLSDPKSELKRLRDGYNEITGAKAIAPHLDPARNRSASFRHTMQAIRDLTAA
jgi:hypothetical protein